MKSCHDCKYYHAEYGGVDGVDVYEYDYGVVLFERRKRNES